MSGPPVDYVARVNLAIDHIVANLEEPLSLDRVAEVAAFSPFHFHRVFKALVGETLNDFVKRLRLERALVRIARNGPETLTETAFACGFSSSSDFSRSFKQRYGVPPSAFDVSLLQAERRRELERLFAGTPVENRMKQLPPGENPDGFEATLRDLPTRDVAYLRVLDPYQPDRVVDAARRLVRWADDRGLADGQWLGYMWDDPSIVSLADCRYDVAVEVPRGTNGGGDVGTMSFPAMRVAEVEIRGGIDLEQRALDWLFGTWLPRSGHEPASLPAFEAWIGRPFAHGLEHFELRAQLPIELPGR